ncbi:YbhB/YbcL family Raf kinase inhibitor-like protein [Actinocorallia populi]|uniref:YbhB/YbcL family Raf kinase inhibitor-like protein n=1 Tax=Actinocorallia populi TaxID=2079200 RepID=UPI000D087A7F|nr:YbhB/YbcL family Raf kinase inhibitor-like protein [Actinocorallia populi]
MKMTSGRAAALGVALLLPLISGCGVVGSGSGDGGELTEFTVSSPAFSDLKDIPGRYQCEARGGQGRTLPLHWSGVPESKAFAIVVDDPDARGGTYIHWVLANLDGTTADLVEASLPDRAVQGRNSAGQASYAAPCPPAGERHRYRYTVYALKEPVPAGQVAELKDSLPAIAERTVGWGRITGYLGQSADS